MRTHGCATEYGAPEAPVSGLDKLQHKPVRAWLTSWVEPREKPSRPKGERVFVLPRKEATMTDNDTEKHTGEAVGAAYTPYSVI